MCIRDRRKGEPNSRWSTEDYIEANKDGWNDIKCIQERYFICAPRPSNRIRLTLYNGVKILFSTVKKTKEQAEHYCRNTGMRLLRITNRRINVIFV